MAGILKVDQVQSDSNLAFAIAGSNVAFMNASSLQMVGSNVSLAGTNVITNGKLVTAAQPVGAVLQVVSFGTYASVSTNTNTETDTGVFATITPISATSKILVLVTLMGVYKSNSNSSSRVHLNLYRGTNSGTLINNSGANFYTQSTVDQRGAIALSVLDSPSTTSAQIYKLYFYNDENVATVSVNRDGNSGTSTMTLMEIAA